MLVRAQEVGCYFSTQGSLFHSAVWYRANYSSHLVNYLTTSMCQLSWNLGASTSWNPQGPSRDCFFLPHKMELPKINTHRSHFLLLLGPFLQSLFLPLLPFLFHFHLVHSPRICWHLHLVLPLLLISLQSAVQQSCQLPTIGMNTWHSHEILTQFTSQAKHH